MIKKIIDLLFGVAPSTKMFLGGKGMVEFWPFFLVFGLTFAEISRSVPSPPPPCFQSVCGLDSFRDGIQGNFDPFVGRDSVFELYGVGSVSDSETVTIWIYSNFPLNGTPSPRATDGRIAWGDLFFHMGASVDLTVTNNLQFDQNQGNFLAIRFAPDSGTSKPPNSYFFPFFLDSSYKVPGRTPLVSIPMSLQNLLY